MPPGSEALNVSTIHEARTSPRLAPITPRTRDSVSTNRMMRMRLAPRVERTAISRVRAVLRARSRLARFTQAIKSRNPTAANRIHNAWRRVSRTSQRLPGSMIMPIPASGPGYCSANPLQTDSRSEKAAKGGLHAEQREKSRGSAGDGYVFGITEAGEVRVVTV